MRTNVFPLIAVFLCLVAVQAYAIPKVQEVKAGDVSAWLIEDRNVPAVSFRLMFVDAGYASDPEALQGRAALAATLLLKGTQTQDATAFKKALEAKAIEIQASAGLDDFTIGIKTLSEFSDDALRMLSEALRNPRLEMARIAESKAQFAAARERQFESPYYIGKRAMQRIAFGGHAYANEKLGTKNTIVNVDAEQLRSFYQTYLTSENLILAVSGDISAASLKELLEEYFSDLPKNFVPEEPINDVIIPNKPVQKQVIREIPQSVIYFGTQGIARDDPLFYAAYVMNHIVGGSTLTSRLGEKVRKENGYTYGINTSLEIDRYAQQWGGGFATKAETAEPAKEVMRQTLQTLYDDGVTTNEVEQAKRYITGSFPLNIDSNDALANYVVSMQYHDLGRDYLQKRNDYFNAVTVEQVNQVVKRLLDPQALIEVTVGQPPQAELSE